MKDIVPYKMALIAKEKGFNEECLCYYKPLKDWQAKDPEWTSKADNGFLLKIKAQAFGWPIATITNSIFVDSPKFVAAPIYSQLINWLADKGMLINKIFRYDTQGLRMKGQYMYQLKTEWWGTNDSVCEYDLDILLEITLNKYLQ